MHECRNFQYRASGSNSSPRCWTRIKVKLENTFFSPFFVKQFGLRLIFFFYALTRDSQLAFLLEETQYLSLPLLKSLGRDEQPAPPSHTYTHKFIFKLTV